MSDDQVDALLRTPDAQRTGGGKGENDREMETTAPGAASTAAHLPLQRIRTAFGLDEFESRVLLMAAAPELDLRYELLYSYLNNDVTRKRPKLRSGAALVLHAKEERWSDDEFHERALDYSVMGCCSGCRKTQTHPRHRWRARLQLHAAG